WLGASAPRAAALGVGVVVEWLVRLGQGDARDIARRRMSERCAYERIAVAAGFIRRLERLVAVEAHRVRATAKRPGAQRRGVTEELSERRARRHHDDAFTLFTALDARRSTCEVPDDRREMLARRVHLDAHHRLQQDWP